MARQAKKDQRPIYNRLRVLRAELNLNRADLADRVGVNPQTIGAIERGDHFPSLDLALNICEVFALPVESVFSREAFSYSPSAYGAGVARIEQSATLFGKTSAEEPSTPETDQDRTQLR